MRNPHLSFFPSHPPPSLPPSRCPIWSIQLQFTSSSVEDAQFVRFSARRGIEPLACCRCPGEGYSTLGLRSFLYASKRCSPLAPYRVFFLVLARFCSPSLETIVIVASTTVIVAACLWAPSLAVWQFWYHRLCHAGLGLQARRRG
jgi:hypothetical protein